MEAFIPWYSQPLDLWTREYAQGKFSNLDRWRTHYIEKGEGKPVFLHGILTNHIYGQKT